MSDNAWFIQLRIGEALREGVPRVVGLLAYPRRREFCNGECHPQPQKQKHKKPLPASAEYGDLKENPLVERYRVGKALFQRWQKNSPNSGWHNKHCPEQHKARNSKRSVSHYFLQYARSASLIASILDSAGSEVAENRRSADDSNRHCCNIPITLKTPQ
jgi:hypothetical protein